MDGQSPDRDFLNRPVGAMKNVEGWRYS
jgi:hypothetical protein